MNSHSVVFVTAEKEKWLRTISGVIGNIHSFIVDNIVKIDFQQIKQNDIYPFHLVSLACLIQSIKDLNYLVSLSADDEQVLQYLVNDLRFKEYFTTEVHYAPAINYKDIMNLWRIKDDQKDAYSYTTVDFLKHSYFDGYDLSHICECLQELFYNVFDHADANGNAFTMLRYINEQKTLYVAVCDFGKGLSQTVRDYDPMIKNDADAIIKALESGFTVHSTERNRGFGLDNILSSAYEARVVSKSGLVYIYKNKKHKYDLDFCFNGTMIYVEYKLDNLQLEDFIQDFTL